MVESPELREKAVLQATLEKYYVAAFERQAGNHVHLSGRKIRYYAVRVVYGPQRALEYDAQRLRLVRGHDALPVAHRVAVVRDRGARQQQQYRHQQPRQRAGGVSSTVRHRRGYTVFGGTRSFAGSQNDKKKSHTRNRHRTHIA